MPLAAAAIQTRRTEEPEPELLPLPVRTVGGSFPSSPVPEPGAGAVLYARGVRSLGGWERLGALHQ